MPFKSMSFKSTQRGISAIEYVILAVLIVAAVAAAVAVFGADLLAAFTQLGTDLKTEAGVEP